MFPWIEISVSDEVEQVAYCHFDVRLIADFEYPIASAAQNTPRVEHSVCQVGAVLFMFQQIYCNAFVCYCASAMSGRGSGSAADTSVCRLASCAGLRDSHHLTAPL